MDARRDALSKDRRGRGWRADSRRSNLWIVYNLCIGRTEEVGVSPLFCCLARVARKPTRKMPETPQTTMLERITAIAERAAKREGLEVWDVEVAGAGRGRIVRIYLDKPGGVTLDDCELISQQVGTVLDVEDVVPDQHYNLEVSSPGVERRLFKPEHFARFTGEKVRLTLREPIENRRRWEGTVRGVEGGVILIETDGGAPLRLRMEQIEKAHLNFEW